MTQEDSVRTVVVMADPPWPQRKGGLRSARPRQGRELDYPTLTLEEIGDILTAFPADVLFLWTIDKYLQEAQELMEKAGLRLHARLIWDKGNGVAPAFTVRFSHEYLLWGYCPPMPPVACPGKYTTVIREPSTRHSKKPDAAFSLVEDLYPSAEYIELFARAERPGWLHWGNEIPNTIEPNEVSRSEGR